MARTLHGRGDMCRALLLRALTAIVLVVGCSSAPADGTDGTKPKPDPTPMQHEGESEESKKQEKDPDTELVVGIDAEPFQSQGLPLGQLEVRVTVDGLVAASETLLASAGALFPHEVRLHPPKDKPEAAVEIEVVGRDRPDAMFPPIVARRATTHFVKGQKKLAYVFLEVRCNTAVLAGGSGPTGPTCTAPTTCVAGRCVPAELPPLTDYRADWAESPPSACGSGAPELVVGQGETALASLADGATVQLEEGPQCGHHLWFSLRMKNLAQSGTITTFTATQPGSTLAVPATAYPYAWGPSEGGSCDLVGLRFQLDAAGARAADFLGKPLDVTVQLADKAGQTISATRHLNIASEMKIIPGRSCGSGPSG